MKSLLLAVTWVGVILFALVITVPKSEGQAILKGSAADLEARQKYLDMLRTPVKSGGIASPSSHAKMVDVLRNNVIAAQKAVDNLMEEEGFNEFERECVYKFVNRRELRPEGHTPRIDKLIASPEVRRWLEKDTIYNWEKDRK